MSDEFYFDPVLAIKILFERENHQHLADVSLHQLQPPFSPSPQLWRHVVEDRDAERVKFFREPEVEIWEVNQDRCRGSSLLSRLHQSVELAIDLGQVLYDFG